MIKIGPGGSGSFYISNWHIDEFMQEKRNSIANVLELSFS